VIAYENADMLQGILLWSGLKLFLVTPITGVCEHDNEISVSVRKIFIDIK
jgi:hypothetical protein